MPRKEVDRVDERTKFAMGALERFKEDGRAGLNDRTRRPKKSPRDTAEEVVTELVRLKIKRMAW